MSELDKAIDRFTKVTCDFLDNGLQAIEAVNAGLGMIQDAESQARAERRAADFTKCPACQSALVPFLKDNPHADTETTQAVTETLFETCEFCIAELDAIQKCEHGNSLEFGECEHCLDQWVKDNEPEEDYRDFPSRWEKENIHV